MFAENPQQSAPAVAAEAPTATVTSQYIDSMETEEPPFIEDLEPENISVLRGDKFKLKAKFLGSEPLTIEWIRGKSDLLVTGACVRAA